jgi:two-component system CheB/CheR fusion protein
MAANFWSSSTPEGSDLRQKKKGASPSLWAFRDDPTRGVPHMETNTTPSLPSPPSGQATFPIVGIGASAGGLKAFTRLFEHLPAVTGIAYVVIQHLDPMHASLLPSLLARVTPMSVQEGQDQMLLRPDHIVVIPPHADLTLKHDRLHLHSRTPDYRPHLPIDTFFRSLAHERKQQAIGVLLSGTATDGTAGLQAIKAVGGITFAQDAHSAQYPQMPQSAIEAGWVDHILPPEEIARELVRLQLPPPRTGDLAVKVPAALPEVLPTEVQALKSILLLLRQHTGVNFLAYKQSTLKRRILHRMAVLQIAHLVEYDFYLREHPAEIKALYEKILIHVTQFFRDQAAFTALTDHAWPSLLDHLASGDTIRIWVPGCATGEEVYSLAICLHEFLYIRQLSPSLHFFGTDISSSVLEHARAGIYPSSALSAISRERLQHFFTPVDRERRSYRIDPAIREQCVFALHNLAKDPPFSRLDLVSCRNILIYMGTPLQQKVLQTLHYALKPHGLLLLGSSESVNPLSRLFTPVEKRQKLFSKKAVSGISLPPLAWNEEISVALTVEEGDPQMAEETTKGANIQQEVDRLLLTHYAPASVLIDAEMEILRVGGHTSSYLELAPGTINLNLLKMARDGLRLGLRAAVHAAHKDNRPVTKEGLQVSIAGVASDVRITVYPLKGPPAGQFFLVIFETISSLPVAPLSPSDKQPAHASRRSRAAQRIAVLEQELTAIRTEMQDMLEEHDVAKEELQTANEEILSSNEELQSSNEELETAQEELQTTNQELIMLNQALETRNEQVQAASEYTEAIVETLREPLLVLSQDLRIERANTAFYQCFQAMPPQTEGCVLSELGEGQWDLPSLQTLLNHVWATKQPFRDFEVEQVFPGIGHKIMLLNARCIVQSHELLDNPLLLLVMEDVTERREVERQKDALIALVSHELKTPITSAKLALQLLQQRLIRAGNASLGAQLETITAHLNRLTHMINSFLDTTVLEGGGLSMYPASFAIDDLVREVVEELGQTTASHRLRYEQEAQVEVYGDRERTGQVLSNLLANAIKYSPATETIRVSAFASENLVTVCVQDRGSGIPQDQQTRIFERFSRTDESLHQQVPGVGLGLYLAAEITKRQGGRIWVESTPGQGATFCFTVPQSAESMSKKEETKLC